MDLARIAQNVGGAGGKRAVTTWLLALRGHPSGSVIVAHIRGELNLQRGRRGRAAVARFVAAAARRTSADPVDWYRDMLTRERLLLQGAAADPSLPRELCKFSSAWSAWAHLSSVTNRPLLPAPSSARGPAAYRTVEQWLRTWVCSPLYLDHLDPTRLVSGDPPVVFSSFEEDRLAHLPDGTPVNRCRAAVGLDPLDPPEAHVILRYRRDEVGPARLPSCFDAGAHPHFLPAPSGARVGKTRDLAGGPGLREVVVEPFPVAALDQPIFVPT